MLPLDRQASLGGRGRIWGGKRKRGPRRDCAYWGTGPVRLVYPSLDRRTRRTPAFRRLGARPARGFPCEASSERPRTDDRRLRASAASITPRRKGSCRRTGPAPCCGGAECDGSGTRPKTSRAASSLAGRARMTSGRRPRWGMPTGADWSLRNRPGMVRLYKEHSVAANEGADPLRRPGHLVSTIETALWPRNAT